MQTSKFLALLFFICTLALAEINPEIEVALKTNQYDKALWLTKQNIYQASDQELAPLYYYLGAAYAGLKRNNLADAAFKEFFKHPFDMESAYKIARYYELQERPEQTEYVYEQIIKNSSEQKRATEALGPLYFKKQKYQEVVNLLSPLLKNNPKLANPQAYYVGASYFQLGDNANAEKYLKMAMDEGFLEADVYYKLGKISINKIAYAKGIEYILQGVKLSGDNAPASAFADLGFAYTRLGETKMAEEAFRRALELGDQSGSTYILYSDNALRNKNYSEVVNYLEPKVARFENSAQFLYNLAVAYEYTNEADKAMTTYQKVLNLDPSREEKIRAKLDSLTHVKK